MGSPYSFALEALELGEDLRDEIALLYAWRQQCRLGIPHSTSRPLLSRLERIGGARESPHQGHYRKRTTTDQLPRNLQDLVEALMS